MAPTPTFDAADPIVLGANPLVGLSRGQVAAALGRLAQRAAVEPGVVVANMLNALGELVEVVVGRCDVAPDPRDKRFAHPAWTANPIYHRLVQAYMVDTKALLDVDQVDLARTCSAAPLASHRTLNATLKRLHL